MLYSWADWVILSEIKTPDLNERRAVVSFWIHVVDFSYWTEGTCPCLEVNVFWSWGSFGNRGWNSKLRAITLADSGTGPRLAIHGAPAGPDCLPVCSTLVMPSDHLPAHIGCWWIFRDTLRASQQLQGCPWSRERTDELLVSVYFQSGSAKWISVPLYWGSIALMPCYCHLIIYLCSCCVIWSHTILITK